jgi:hypothetical protein
LPFKHSRKRYQLNLPRGQLRQPALEHGQGFRIGMADGKRLTLALRQSQ